MKLFVCWLLAAIGLVPWGLHGEIDRGNGGDVVVCPDNHEDLEGGKISMLDYYETQKKWNLVPNLGGAELTVLEKVELILSRIREMDPLRYKKYHEYVDLFFEESLIEPDLRIPEINDDGVIRLPNDSCSIEQIAAQMEPELPGDKRYYIKKELYDQLSRNSKAALILHEVLYRDALQSGHQNSRRVRYFNAYLMSGEVSKFSFNDYHRFLRDEIELKSYYKFTDAVWLSDLEFLAKDVHFDEMGNKVSAIIRETTGELQQAHGKVPLSGSYYFSFSDSNTVVTKITTGLKKIWHNLALNEGGCSFQLPPHAHIIEISLDPSQQVERMRVIGLWGDRLKNHDCDFEVKWEHQKDTTGNWFKSWTDILIKREG